MADALERLHGAGADFGLIATNTMHIVFEEVQRAVHMPLHQHRASHGGIHSSRPGFAPWACWGRSSP